MTLNGEYFTLDSPSVLADVLESHDFDVTRLAAELNGAIVPRAQYQDVIVTDADTLEVVTFVGGG